MSNHYLEMLIKALSLIRGRDIRFLSLFVVPSLAVLMSFMALMSV
jgi:hypothetical protein